MIAIIWILEVVAGFVMVFQLWTGLAVLGTSLENDVIDRRKSPGPYWFIMTFEMAVSIALPVLAHLAGR